MDNMNEIIEHYPPQLVTLITEVLPILFVKRKDILFFFANLHVPDEVLADIRESVSRQENSISKYMMIRTILYRLSNNKKNNFLRERYEILKRLIEFKDFDICWPNTIDKAKSIISKIENLDRENSWLKEMKKSLGQKKEKHEKQKVFNQIKIQKNLLSGNLLKLLSDQDGIKRSEVLAGIMNHFFTLYEITIIDTFRKNVLSDEGLIAHIEGVVEINKDMYLLEIKWARNKLGLRKFQSIS